MERKKEYIKHVAIIDCLVRRHSKIMFLSKKKMICCVPPTPRERQIGELFYFLQNKDKKSNVKELEYTLAAGSAEGAKSKELVIPLSDDKFKTNFAGYHVHYRILTLPCPDKEDTLIVKEEMTIMIDGDDSEPGLLTAQAMYENKGKDSVGAPGMSVEFAVTSSKGVLDKATKVQVEYSEKKGRDLRVLKIMGK